MISRSQIRLILKKLHKMKYLFSILTLALLLGSCQTVNYISDFKSDHDFTPYKTYNFMKWKEANNRYINGINKDRILSAIDKEMASRGYTKSPNPDIMLNVNVIIEERKGTQAYTTYMGGYYTPIGYGVTTYQEYTYLVGSLIIDIFDNKTKSQVWHGAAMGEVDQEKERTESKINTVINRILKRYPIQPVE